MNKILDMFDRYPNNNETIKNGGLCRVSRWITIRRNCSPGNNNRLWEYVTDGNGYSPYQEQFTPENGLSLDYFRFNGRTYAIEQFYTFGSIADCVGHFCGYIENGEKHYLSGYDSEDIFHPILIELDEYCEKVRIYKEV